MSDTPPAGTDLVPFADEDEVAKVVAAKELLESYAAMSRLVTLEEYRLATVTVANNMLLGVLTGEFGKPKGPKEAIEIAHKALDLVQKRDVGELAEDLGKITDPAERKELFDRFRAEAQAAAAAAKRDQGT